MKINFLSKISIILAIFMTTVIFSVDTYAASGTCFFGGGTCNAGDSSNPYGFYGTNDVLTGRSSTGAGQAIPDSVTDKSSFVNFVLGRFNSGGTQDRIGAAFLIQKLRGKTGWPSYADANTDWVSIMNQSGVAVDKALNVTVGATSYYDSDKKDVFYGGHPNASRDVIRIWYNNVAIAWIEVACGNLTANSTNPPPPPPPPPPLTSNACRPIKFKVEPKTYTSGTSPHHPGSTTTTVPVTVYTSNQNWGSYSSSVTIDATSNHTTGDVYSVTFAETASHVSGYTDNYVDDLTKPIYGNDYSKPIKDKDGNVTGYEQKIVGYQQKYSGTTTNYSGPNSWSSSIGPCYDYKLTSNMNSFSARVEAGASVSVNPVVTSSSYTGSYHTHSKSSKWQIVKMIIAPNVVLPAANGGDGGSVNTNPCDYFDPGHMSTCSIQQSDSSTIFSVGGNPSVGLGVNFNTPDVLPGTKICFAFALFPNQSDPKYDSPSPGSGDTWNYAGFDPAGNCITIVKKPKAQIWAGDLWVGGQAMGSLSVKNSKTFGSWDEYGIFAGGISGIGAISGVASGSAFADINGLANTNASMCNYSILSFTNADASTCGFNTVKGNYKSARSIPDVAASFPTAATTPALPAATALDNLQGLYKTNGNLTISGGNIQKSKWVVINAPNATVTIAGNINYTNGVFKKISEIPQVVIIAKKIVINNNVTNVDAWLIANDNNKTGEIETCDNFDKTINTCSLKLTVNGPVMTDHLYLYRTAGSGAGVNSGDPAEVFNLRADAYLWSASQVANNSRMQTVYTADLPPRF